MTVSQWLWSPQDASGMNGYLELTVYVFTLNDAQDMNRPSRNIVTHPQIYPTSIPARTRNANAFAFTLAHSGFSP